MTHDSAYEWAIRGFGMFFFLLIMVYIVGNKEDSRYVRVYDIIFKISRRTYLQLSIIPNVSTGA